MDEIRSYWQVPGIANFCYLFSEAFHLPRVNYDELENSFLHGTKTPLFFDADTETMIACEPDFECVDIENRNVLVKLICSLLRGCMKKTIDFSNWESRLVELFELNSEDENQPSPFRGRRIDKNGKIVEFKMSFDELSLYEKVKVVYALCEMRFYREDKLKEINQIEEDELRVEPLGQDSEGCLYWYFYGTRLYKENPRRTKLIIEKRAKIERLKELEFRSMVSKSKMLNKKQMQANRGKINQEESSSIIINGNNGITPNGDVNGNTNGSTTPNGLTNGNTHTPNSLFNGLKPLIPQIPLPEITEEELKDAWSVICKTEADWSALAESFQQSKSPYEKHLHTLLTDNFVPNIHEQFLRIEREQRKRQLELIPKRNSSRLQIKRLQQEEEERIQRLQVEEERRATMMNRKYATRHNIF